MLGYIPFGGLFEFISINVKSNLPKFPFSVQTSSKGSGETVHLRSLV